MSAHSTGEKAAQRPISLFGRLFGEEMAAVDAVAGDGLGVLAPDGEHVVATALRAALAPQDEKRHREVAAAIGAVVDEVDRGTGAILVAGRPDRLGVAEASQIFGEGLRLQHGGSRSRWRRKNSRSAPISRSGSPPPWIRKNQ